MKWFKDIPEDAKTVLLVPVANILCDRRYADHRLT
jgi:hypothetical protein